VGLATISYNGLHQLHSCHGCAAIELLDLFGVGIDQEFIQVVAGARLVTVTHIGVFVRADLGPVWKINFLLAVEWSIQVLLIDVLNHGLIIVAAEVLIVVIHLHPGSSPRSGHCVCLSAFPVLFCVCPPALSLFHWTVVS